MYEGKDTPVSVEFLTIKDVIELVGCEPLGMEMRNKWATLIFPCCTFSLKVQK